MGGESGSEDRRWSPGQADSWPGSEGPLSGSNSRWGVYGVKPVHGYSFRVGPAFWRREGEVWSIFSPKPDEAGVCKEGMGQGDTEGLMWGGVEEGR